MDSVYDSRKLFLALCEDLKLPLVRVAAISDLGAENIKNFGSEINKNSRYSLKLIEGFQLAVGCDLGQTQLDLMPTSLGAMIGDLGQEIKTMFGERPRLSVADNLMPVMGNKEGINYAMHALVFSAINGMCEEQDGVGGLKLYARRSKYGIKIALQIRTSPDRKLGNMTHLVGDARRPLSSLSNSSASGLFIAKSLAESMGAKFLIKTRGNNLHIGFALRQSEQLKMEFA